LALFGALGFALGSAAASPSLLAAAATALAAAFALHLSAWRSNAEETRRERERMAHIDRQIVEILRRHASLLERRKAQLEAAGDRGEALSAWDRDIARFHEQFVHERIAPYKRAESDAEILARVQLAADEVLSLRARVSRSAA
jgi:recombinational DNA repair ATPase RecF